MASPRFFGFSTMPMLVLCAMTWTIESQAQTTPSGGLGPRRQDPPGSLAAPSQAPSGFDPVRFNAGMGFIGTGAILIPLGTVIVARNFGEVCFTSSSGGCYGDNGVAGFGFVLGTVGLAALVTGIVLAVTD